MSWAHPDVEVKELNMDKENNFVNFEASASIWMRAPKLDCISIFMVPLECGKCAFRENWVKFLLKSKKWDTKEMIHLCGGVQSRAVTYPPGCCFI